MLLVLQNAFFREQHLQVPDSHLGGHAVIVNDSYFHDFSLPLFLVKIFCASLTSFLIEDISSSSW